MLEELLTCERDLFLLLNGNHTSFLDGVAWLFSGRIAWLPAAVFLLVSLTYKVKWREWLPVLLGIALVAALCDQFSSHICKPLFMRLRPTHHPDFMDQVHTVFDYRGGLYGFISGHAANAFGLATFFALLLRNPFVTVTVYVWAALVAYSRIYLGVHFISDIVPGALSGIFFGYLSYMLYKHFRPQPQPQRLYTPTRCRSMGIALLANMVGVFLFSPWLTPLCAP